MPQEQFSKSELERRQTRALRDVEFEQLREEPTLKRVAEAAAVVCEVARAHVSVVESDQRSVVGQVGLSDLEAARQIGFCQEAIVEDRIVIVEDVDANEAFEAKPFSRYLDDIGFYAGLPLLVDNTPVGTLTLLDERPRELDQLRRAALFGLVHDLESHLRVHTEMESEDDPREAISKRLTAMVAHTTRLRWNEPQSEATQGMIDDMEDEIEAARRELDRLIDREPRAGLDEPDDETAEFEELAPTNPNESTLGYVDTEVD
jgi:GAF domain-containing protein